jgi:hypothetical protein
MVKVVSIFIAAGNRQHTGAQDVIDTVGHQSRVTRISNQLRQLRRNP